MRYLAMGLALLTLAGARLEHVGTWGSSGFAHIEMPYGISFSPDGRELVTCGNEETLRLWDAASGRALGTLGEYSRFVGDVEFSPDGRTIACAGSTEDIDLWDVATRERVARFGERPRMFNRVQWLAGGARLLTGGSHLALWDVAGRKPVWVCDRGVFDCLAINADESRALTAWRQRVLVHDLADGRVVAELQAPAADVRGLCFDGALARGACADGTLVTWDLRSGALVARVATGVHVYSVAWLSPGRVALGPWTGGLSVHERATGRRVWEIDAHTRFTVRIRLSPDHRVIASDLGDNRVHLLDAADGRRLHERLGHDGRVTDVVPLASGRVATAGDDGRLVVWDPGTGRPVLDRAVGVRGLAIADAGDAVLAASRLGGVSLERLDGSGPAWSIGTGMQNHVAAVSPDRRRFAVGMRHPDQGGPVWIGDLADGRILHRFSHSSTAAALAFLPDGLLLSGCMDGELRLTDVDSGERRLVQVGRSVRGIAVGPGDRAVTVDGGGALRVWRASTLEPLGAVAVQPHPLAVALTSDGVHALVAGFAPEVQLVDVRTLRVVASAPLPARGDGGMSVARRGDEFLVGTRLGVIERFRFAR